MKIPNYDSKSSSEHVRKLCDFISEDYRMLIAGASHCGKTNLLMFILRKPLVFYDKIYFYTPNHHQDKIQDLIKLMQKISDHVGYNVLEIDGEADIKNTNEYQNDNRKIVIFDDMMNASPKIQEKIANHFTDGRHHKISPIYLSQSYFNVPQKIRLNCSHMILYPPSTKNNLQMIARENLLNPNLFDKLKKYEFLFVDKGNKSVKKNFDENV